MKEVHATSTKLEFISEAESVHFSDKDNINYLIIIKPSIQVTDDADKVEMAMNALDAKNEEKFTALDNEIRRRFDLQTELL